MTLVSTREKQMLDLNNGLAVHHHWKGVVVVDEVLVIIWGCCKRVYDPNHHYRQM